jgi:tetratricopeptide (TPR) repeat protein
MSAQRGTPRALLLAVFLVRMADAADLPAVLAQPGFQHIYNLEFDEALADFQEQAAREPSSPGAQNLVAETVISRAMFRAEALTSDLVSDKNPFFKRPKMPMTPEDEKLFLDSVAKAMELANARINQNAGDAQAAYALGVAHGLRADYAFLVKHAWIAALRDITAARKLHARVTALDPDAIDARLTQGLHEYVAGSLVFPWKQLGFLAGFHGHKQTGISMLRLVAERGEINRVDGMVFLAAILRREHRPAEAVPLIEDVIRWFPRNYLFRIELARLYGDLHDKAKALAVVEEIEQLKKSNAPGFARVRDERLRELRESVESGGNPK